MAKNGQRRFLGRDKDGEEEVYDDFHAFERKRKKRNHLGDEAALDKPEDIKTFGLESMEAAREDEASEAGDASKKLDVSGLESMMGDRDEDISDEDMRLDDAFEPEDGAEDVVRRRPKKARIRPVKARKKRQAPAWLRKAMIVAVTAVIVLVLASMILSRLASNMGGDTSYSALQKAAEAPEGLISRIVTPIQSVFSSLTEGVAGYFRTIKLRSNIETEYNKLRAENEQLVYEAMLAQELQQKLSTYENMFDEVSANESMNPITATVIGRADGNYFSTFTINRGTRDGVEDYMAVTISGALIGYTENTSETSAQVRTIIDSEASIAGLIQSSRDQGTVRGTLGVDGTPMCRMYYLPEDHLPRPGDTVVTSGVGMSFPKGIPIGTVRESTRGMESNKQYIVVEPTADFEHIEYVIVLRYKPQAEAVQGRESATDIEFVPIETQRPVPELRIGGSNSFFSVTATATPEAEAEETATATPSPTPTPVPTATPEPVTTPADTSPSYEYVVVDGKETASPSPTPTASPTPYITLSPDDQTWEAD